LSKIEIGRWSEQLRRMMGMAGTEIVSGEMSPEISPTIELEGQSPEWDFLKGKRNCFGGADLGAGGVTFIGKYRLRNPADSGVVAVVKRIELASTAGGVGTTGLRINVNSQTVNLDTAVVPLVPDTRWGALAIQATALILTTSIVQTTGPAGSLLATSITIAGTRWVVTEPFVLVPGTNVDFGASSDNLPLAGWVAWTERAFPVLEQ